MTYPTHDTYLTKNKTNEQSFGKTTNASNAPTSVGNALGKDAIEMLLPLLTSTENPLAELLGVILNAAMKIERQQFLGVEPHHASARRTTASEKSRAKWAG
jgi:hypothetical protein